MNYFEYMSNIIENLKIIKKNTKKKNKNKNKKQKKIYYKKVAVKTEKHKTTQ